MLSGQFIAFFVKYIEIIKKAVDWHHSLDSIVKFYKNPQEVTPEITPVKTPPIYCCIYSTFLSLSTSRSASCARRSIVELCCATDGGLTHNVLTASDLIYREYSP
mgnify:CR=1 FL=1